MFGFEFELLIPVTSGDDYDHLLPPVADRHILGAHPTLGFTLKYDRQALMNDYKPERIWRTEKFKRVPPPIRDGWPGDMTIAELVTDPFVESLDPGEAESRVTKIADWATGLEQSTLGQRVTVAGAGLTPAAAQVNYVGAFHHPPEANRRQPTPITAAAGVHQTYALPLRSVLAEFTFLLSQANQANHLWMDPMRFAAMAIDNSFTSKALAATGDVGGPAAAEDLRGFYALLRYYIDARGKTDVANLALAKNHAALLLFYKTRLSTVRNELTTLYPAIRAALEVKATREAVQQELGAPVGGRFGQWAGEVLAGTADSFFDNAKNEYSDELYAGYPPGRLGIVVENRRIREVQPPSAGANGRYPTADWAGLATTLHKRLLTYQV